MLGALKENGKNILVIRYGREISRERNL